MPQRIGLLSMDFFTALMIIFFVIGILSQILIGILYQHMIEQAENMQNTENKVLRQFKKDFMNCYEINDGMTNVPVFTEKFINRLQFGKLSLGMLKNLSGQCMFLSVLTAGLGICRGFAGGRSFWSLLPYYVITFIGLYLYFSVLSIADTAARRSMLKTNLIDYLENQMIPRLENTREIAAAEPASAAFGNAAQGSKRTARGDAEKEAGNAVPEFAETLENARASFEKRRMPVKEMPTAEKSRKPAGLDWTGGMAEEEGRAQKPVFDREKQEELAELLKDLLS